MNIVFIGGKISKDVSPIAMCTGYRACSLIMKKGDFEQLRLLAYNNPTRFNTTMKQLEGRFR